MVTASTIMSSEQGKVLRILIEWIERMTKVANSDSFTEKDVFVGFQSETPVAVVLQAFKMMNHQRTPLFDEEWHQDVCTLYVYPCNFIVLYINT